VTYVPDLWGGVRRQIENLEALEENQRFTNEATFLTLTSSIALGAIQEASLRAQIQVTERLIRISKQILDKIRIQRDAGQVSELDVASQEALVAQTERFEFTNLKLPRHLPVSLPSDLVAQRPDVRAAEENMHAACALIGVAIANRLPQLVLTGNIGRSGTSFANLFSSNPAFYFYNGMANATQVLFDGFTLQQRQRAAEAGFDQAAAQYRLAVLTAFQNVADALYAIEHDTVALQKALVAEAATLKALTLTRKQLSEGQVSIQIVLNAQTTYLQASLVVVQAQANRYSDTVGLFQALGGGWWNRRAWPHVPEPEAWLTTVLGPRPGPIGFEYPGASQNEARCSVASDCPVPPPTAP
jgi:outer membrane protein TolC